MNILVISSNYPSKAFPNHGAFVYNLMQELAKQHDISVIAPTKVHTVLAKKQATYGEEKCTVYRPLFTSLSNKKIAGINFGDLTSNSYKRAVHKAIKKLPYVPDVIYTHFLSNALPVLDYAREHNIPLVVASGESSYASWEKNPESVKKMLKEVVKHIICVSNENRSQLIQLGFDPLKLTVIPNAVNYDLFAPLDHMECLQRLHLDTAKFTVGFIGHFINRKGPNRIIEAIKKIENEDIQLVCVGGTEEQLTSNSFTKVLSPVPNYRLPEIFGTFDLFVLPTLSEGHCNVIEEAKACAVPIISSKGTSVEEQVDSAIGILVDPMDIEEIAAAILKLKNDKQLLESMRNELINRRGENSLSERAIKINHVLNNVI